MKIPYINQQHYHEIKAIIKSSEFNITPIFTSGIKLKDFLTRSSFSPKICSNDKCPLANNLCFKKNVIYQIKCNLCDNIYIGETKRFLHDRIKEHLRSIKNEDNKSAFAEHFIKNHPKDIFKKEYISVKLLDTAKDDADRFIKESISIANLSPEINREKGWKLLSL